MGRPVLAVIALVALAAGARYERVIRKQFASGPGRRVIVLHRYGSIEAVGSTAPGSVTARVVVTAGSEPAARRFGDAIDVSVESGEDSAIIATVHPCGAEPGPDLSYEVNLALDVPARALLDCRNSFGDVRLEAMTGGSFVSNRYGFVEAERCRQVEVENRYGDVRLFDVEGPAEIDNEFGNVVLRRTRGRVSVENRYGRVDAEGPNGDVHITNRFGSVLARQGQGRLAIANRYGRVAAWVDDPDLARLDLVSELGRVELNLLAGLPARVGGMTRSGAIVTRLPLRVVSESSEQSVAGSIGQGGPAIELHGLLSDFIIRPDSGPAPRGARP
jgi:hypothetical protein